MRKTERRVALLLRFARLTFGVFQNRLILVSVHAETPDETLLVSNLETRYKKRNETPIIPFLFPTRYSLLIACFGEACQFGETGRIRYGEIGQHLSVYLDPSRFQSMDQLTV